jgi:hypothetical protein
MVMFIVFWPMGIVICTVVLVVFASTNVACTVPVIVICPVQTMFAVMPVAVSDTSVIWQFPRAGCVVGPPYLSIIACVTQTWLVRGGICGMFVGPPDMLICVVTSHRPDFRLCPCATAASATKQKPIVNQTLVLFTNPPGSPYRPTTLFDFIAGFRDRERVFS